MAKIYKTSRLRTLSKNGSLVFCENCEKIVASINRSGYRYVNISLVCSCGIYGSVEIARKNCDVNLFERIKHIPKSENGVLVCPKCKTQMLGVIESRVQNYSFYVQCICGEKYDTRPISGARLEETAKLLKEMKNK